jgi:hypothetical protein
MFLWFCVLFNSRYLSEVWRMKEETFYRFMHDAGLNCPECGKKLDIFAIIVGEMCFMDGRPSKGCPHCKKPLELLKYRDYGVSKKAWERMNVFEGLPTPYSELKKKKPLWMI